MKTFEEASIVLELSDEMRRHGSWTGETHIQKAIYFLQSLVQVPTEFDFILYKHGPFSFDLRATLTFMEAEDLVCWQPRPYPYGPSLQPGPDHNYLRRHFGKFVREYKPQIEFVSERLALKDVKHLERLATALYISLEGGNPKERPAKLNGAKPHVSLEQAREAVEELDTMIAAAGRLGLIAPLSS